MQRLIGRDIYEYRGTSAEGGNVLVARIAQLDVDELSGEQTYSRCRGHTRQMEREKFDSGHPVQFE